MTIPSAAQIRAAHERIAPYIHRTPLMTSECLDRMLGGKVVFKCENFQKAGAFKSRGAVNAVISLAEGEARHGVATHSSGNHAQALARAAGLRGLKAYIVMPSNSSRVKVEAVKGYGGIITFCEPTLQAREDTLRQVLSETGATEIHPYNNLVIITGQATAARELIEDSPAPLDIVMAPVGGGGLLSGTALSCHHFSPAAMVIAAEPEMANDAWQSFKSGSFVPSVNPQTIADGLRTSLGTMTFPIIREFVDDIVTVSEAGIVGAMKLLWERMKIIVEPSSAVPLAALLEGKLSLKGRRAGIILSGGNVDLENLPW